MLVYSCAHLECFMLERGCVPDQFEPFGNDRTYDVKCNGKYEGKYYISEGPP